MLRFEKLDLVDSSELDWVRCYALHRCAHAEQGTTARSIEAYRASQLAAANARARTWSWIARDGDQILGKLDLSGAATGMAAFNLYVHPQARLRGVARALVVAALRQAQQDGAQIVETTTMQPESWRLCERFRGRFERGSAQLTLSLASARWDVVDDWCRSGPRRSSGTHLQVIERVPDALVEEFLALHNRAWSGQPHAATAGPPLTHDSLREQERTLESMGWRWIKLVARVAQGVLTGMTDVRYDPLQPDIVRQNFTGVLPSHRDRGLAKWLKASMLRLIRDRFPGALRVSTTNADSNIPMLAINRQLGFEAPIPHRAYRFDLTQLREALERSVVP